MAEIHWDVFVPIVGGNWSNGALGGVFALNLNNAPSNSNTNIGFRLANPKITRIAIPRGCERVRDLGDMFHLAADYSSGKYINSRLRLVHALEGLRR